MEEMIFNLADTHLFFNDLEVSHYRFIGAYYLLACIGYEITSMRVGAVIGNTHFIYTCVEIGAHTNFNSICYFQI